MSHPQKVTLHVERTSADGTVRCVSTYDLDLQAPATVGQLLLRVRAEVDPTLAFRYSCGLGRCGTCTAYLDGKPVLTCQEPIRKAEMHLAPLPKRRVIRDLILRNSVGG